MLRENVADLLGFVAVVRECSFTRAAATLGMSQSALPRLLREPARKYSKALSVVVDALRSGN